MAEIRAKKVSTGKYHLFIDAYNNGKRKKTYLKIYTQEDYTKPLLDKHGAPILNAKGLPQQRPIHKEDKVNWELAQKVRIDIENQINKKTYGFETADFSRKSFTDYFKQYVTTYKKKDFRKGVSCYKMFESYNQMKQYSAQASFHEINEEYIIKFLDYLAEHTTGDTTSGYFRFLKGAIKAAYKSGFLKSNFAEDVSAKRGDMTIQKNVLSIEELRLMHQTPIRNKDIANAFFFAYFTGLDLATLRTISRENIYKRGHDTFLKGARTKTKVKFDNLLPDYCVEIIKEQKEKHMDKLFVLPSDTSVRKTIVRWAANAGVDKHITFTCARHSFGTNLIANKTDIKSASELMAHKGLREIDKYVKAVGALKSQAIHNLPKI